MKNLNRPIGCGLWLVGLLLALFAAEWLLLWLVIRSVPADRLPQAVLMVVVLTVVGGWIATYLRVQRRVS